MIFTLKLKETILFKYNSLLGAMMKLRFCMKQVEKLIEDINSSSEFFPTIEDYFNPNHYQDNKFVNKEGLTLNEVDSPETFLPDFSKIIESKIKPKLELVVDSGVYLINNVKREGSSEEAGLIVYAVGFNPAIDNDYYEKKRSIFHDDGTFNISVSHYLDAIDNKQDHLVIEIKNRAPI